MLFVGTSIIHPSTEGVFLLCNILDLLIYSLNKETESNYATNAYHEKTYEKYGNVQISAEPLYWKTASQEKLPDEKQKPDKNGNYVNYYILHITWDETVQNNKETDMIYIMAG